MPRHVDDVIDTGHDVHVAVVVNEACVASEIVALVCGQIGFYIALVILPERRGGSRREG